MSTNEREVDRTYLAQLETKLKNLQNPEKLTGKKFLSDIASFKDHQLFHLMTLNPSSSGFEDNFVSDAPITPNYLQRKIAPQTCAISKQELAELVKYDMLQELGEVVKELSDQQKSSHDLFQETDDEFMQELREVRQELAQDSQDGEDEQPATNVFSECGPPGAVEGDVYGGLSKEEYEEFMEELAEMRKEMADDLEGSDSDDKGVEPVSTEDATPKAAK